MSIKFERTRKKRWESGWFYVLPTIRFHWEDLGENIKRKKYDLSIIWITFKLSINWKSWYYI